MRTGKKTNNHGMIEKMFRCRQPDENIASKNKTISAAFRAILIFLPLFFLLSLNWAEAEVPDEHKNCTVCHIEDDSSTLRKGINETCTDCHPTSPSRDHPIGSVIKDVPEKLPLDKENRVTCITCHEPHGKGTDERLLRMHFNKLCVECHKI